MEKTIYRKGEKIKYKSSGEGNVIVLLHGYLESHHVWGDFRTELASDYRVLAIDLPGFGESDEHNMVTYIDGMADAVRAVIDAEDIKKCFMMSPINGLSMKMILKELKE